MRVRLHTLQTNRHTSKVRIRVQDRSGVDSPASDAGVADFSEVDQAILLSRGERYVVNVAESRIEALVESESAVEEVETLE